MPESKQDLKGSLSKDPAPKTLKGHANRGLTPGMAGSRCSGEQVSSLLLSAGPGGINRSLDRHCMRLSYTQHNCYNLAMASCEAAG